MGRLATKLLLFGILGALLTTAAIALGSAAIQRTAPDRVRGRGV